MNKQALKSKNTCMCLHVDKKETTKRKILKIEEKENALMKQDLSRVKRKQDGKYSGQMNHGRNFFLVLKQ